MNTYIKYTDILQPYSTNNFNGNIIEDWTSSKKVDMGLVKGAFEKVGNKIHLRIFPSKNGENCLVLRETTYSFPQ